MSAAVVAENPRNGVEESALAVRAGAVSRDENMFMSEASAAVTNVPLQEPLQLDVVRSNLRKEAIP